MAESDSLVSLDAITQAAEDEGFGARAPLRRRFVEYQGLGLVGKPLGKAERQGGEGLWHPMQLELFLQLLNLRDNDKVRVSTLPNLPVGLWRLGADGITTEQVQRAMSYWAGFLPGAPSETALPGHDSRTGRAKSEVRPRGPRSLVRKAIEQFVDDLSVPETRHRAKRELRDLLEIMNTTGVAASPDTWARVALNVIAPNGNPSSQQRQAVENMQKGFLVQFLTVRHLDLLCSPMSTEFWDWARRVIDESNRDGYLRQQAEMIHDPEVGHLYKRPLGFDLVQQGCRGWTVVLGIGLAVAWDAYGMRMPPGEEPPPALPFTQRT
jgi:hypothetical protein